MLRSTATLGLVLSLAATSGFAADAKKKPAPRDTDVESVKDNYWNRNSSGDVEVVQNRAFTKAGRLSLSAAFGTASSDPFLNVKSGSLSLGYHFSESLGINLVGKKYFVSDSSYMKELRDGLVTGASTMANTNRPNSYFGAEVVYSPLYGKISLSGSSIVHYDAHLLFGAGQTKTESGNYFTPSIGFGPQFYLGSSVAITLDYRLSFYNETIPEKVLTSRTTAGERDNFSHQVALGLALFL